jgi:glycosyltransferase involved in cell wall biosynthesis
MNEWRVGVVIPAHDEEDRIEACLHAIVRSATQADHGFRRVCVVVVADRCRDETVDRARRSLAAMRGAATVVVADAGCPGAARAIGVAAVLQASPGPLTRLWLANTDADTLVPPGWLAQHLDAARAGLAAVAGVVEVDSFLDYPAHVAERFEASYGGPEDLPHSHVHGANLGVRADAYLAVGGWQAVSVGEDHCLWNALRGSGLPVASPRGLTVTTSGRSRGRARGGFADGLNELAAAC